MDHYEYQSLAIGLTLFAVSFALTLVIISM
jgi:hypothetical protein